MKDRRVTTALAALVLLSCCRGDVATSAPAPAPPQDVPRELRGESQGPSPRKLNPDAVAGIEFSQLTDQERLSNYRRVNYDLRVYEDEYHKCISEIELLAFSQEAVDACTGRDMVKVALDVKYVTMRTMSKMDTRIRELFVEDCFKPHMHDEMVLVGCDIMERDARNLMWAGLNFFLILEANKQKYIFEYSKLPYQVFAVLLRRLTAIGHQFFELMNEIDNHKEVTILRLRTLVDDKFRLRREDIQAEGVDDSHHVTHVVEVQEGSSGLPAFGIGNTHISQFNTEGGYEGDRRKLRERPAIDQDARPSARRILNSNGKYAGLHSHGGDNRVIGGSSFARNPALRASLVGRLSASDHAQAKVPFKNIHNRHFSG